MTATVRDICLGDSSRMEWSAGAPSQWVWEGGAPFHARAGDRLRQFQPTDWGIDHGSPYSSGGGGGGCSGFDTGNGVIINFEAASKDLTKRKELGRSEREMPATLGSAESLIGLKLGKRTYFEDACNDSSNRKNISFPAIPAGSSATSTAKKARLSHQAMQIARCQVEGCNADLTAAKDYHRKHKVCEGHSKCSKVVVAGLERRFCQQCSRFHDLSEFDQKKRSCRRRLSDHNARRRKPLAESTPLNSARFSSSFYGLEASAIASNIDGAPDNRRALSLLSTGSWASADPGPTSPINQLVYENHTSPAHSMVHEPCMSSKYWQSEQPLDQEPWVFPFNLHSNGSQFQEFQLLKSPYENTYFDTNHLD